MAIVRVSAGEFGIGLTYSVAQSAASLHPFESYKERGPARVNVPINKSASMSRHSAILRLG